MTAALRDTREIIREGPLMRRPILQALATRPLTIPEIAEAIGRPAHETVYWVMGLRRYRMLVELPEPTDEGYFQYTVADS